MIQKLAGNITTPRGFLAAAVNCGLRKERKDLALIYSEKVANAAAVYTKNKVKAAPLLVTRQHLQDGKLQAIVINSGNANACTGKQGLDDAQRMAYRTAQGLGIDPKLVAVASTGVIGVPLPINLIESGIDRLVQLLRRDGGAQAAEAIMTTDTFRKEIAIQFEVDGAVATIGFEATVEASR